MFEKSLDKDRFNCYYKKTERTLFCKVKEYVMRKIVICDDSKLD